MRHFLFTLITLTRDSIIIFHFFLLKPSSFEHKKSSGMVINTCNLNVYYKQIAEYEVTLVYSENP